MPILKVVLYSKMPDLNEYLNIGRDNNRVFTNKGNYLSVGAIKQNNSKVNTENSIIYEISQIKPFLVKQYVIIVWYVKNKRKDEENIKFKQKFIFDAFQRAGKLINDNMNNVITLFEPVLIDKKEERCEIFFSHDKRELLKFYVDNIFDLIE